MTDAAEVRRLPRRSLPPGSGRRPGEAVGGRPDPDSGPVTLGEALAETLLLLAAGRDPGAEDRWGGAELAEAG